MPKPTLEQLEKINKFALTPLTEDNCYVFKDLMIDNAPTSYFTIIHENLLRKFVRDTRKGVALLAVHDDDTLPIGKSFDAMLIEDFDEEGNLLKSLYGDFYIALGRNTEKGMTTDDIAKGIDTGVISDTSIGFKANSWKCSICGNDIRDFWSCVHWPGEKYIVEDDDGERIETCYVHVGEDGEGELMENSLVYAGACPRASIVNTFSAKSVNSTNKMSKLHVVESFKDIPLNANIYQFYSKNGCVLMTDSSERTGGSAVLRKRSEEAMDFEKFKPILETYSITTPEELELKLKDVEGLNSQLEEKSTQISELDNQNAELAEKLSEADANISKLNEELNALKEENTKLKESAELVSTYKKDLKDEILVLGVRCYGNTFNKELYSKFLDTVSIEELKDLKVNFEKEVNARFSGVKVTSTKVVDKKEDTELYKEDFESEEKYREYVSTKALEYAKENNVSLIEATKLMYAKYSQRGDE